MPARKTRPKVQTKVDATKHAKDTRSNIPTAELEKFAEEDEKKPTTLLYPRDPSLDPQLVWKGKDEQDRADLEVPAVPIYIQETIEPRAMIEDLRRRSKEQSPEDQLDLFGDSFGELEFSDRVDFYRHPGKWSNRLVLGDSLLVMASLAEKEGLKGQVQMIYIDPPYGIKFGSNWQVSTRKRDVRDGRDTDATRQPEQVRAFRDTWELGVHSYLGYLRDRIVVARDLLAASGSLFVQIGDENVHLVRSILDETLGVENFVVEIAFRKTSSANSPLARLNTLGSVCDYIIWYAKDINQIKYRQLFSALTTEELANYGYVEAADGTLAPVGDRAEGRRVALSDTSSQGAAAAFEYEFELGGRVFRPTAGRHWSTTADGLSRLNLAHRLVVKGDRVFYKRYADDFPVRPLANMWDDTQFGGFLRDEKKTYVVQTLSRIVERCLLMTTDPGDLVVDPTCGSGTTAAVAEQWGRRWITVDTSRVALALARTRLMASKFPYWLLADSVDGFRKEGRTGHDRPTSSFGGDIKKGFVYRRVPHVTLRSIANNPEITEGMTREEIDAVIARHAETEVLYDRPHEDTKVVRVSGPFTVESLSPHRVLVTGPEDEPASALAISAEAGRFVERIIDELRAAGVQNTVKDERLTFDTLEPHAGVYIQATGRYRESGRSMVAAVAIGPEYGTVGKELVREAAKEAAEFADILVVCGFAFEALVEEETKVGRLRILKAKMNPDLQMPDLLKKTGAGNLFMVFGEPDIVIATDEDQVTLEIRGLDVYDPTTGEVRSNTTNDIACWFIDTNYNGEAFFVRHAYFLGADDPYGKLKRALRSDIVEETWASLYSTTSRPFPRPSTGKIAVKVINHYGDEIMHVYPIKGVS
jgi:adenine-specific DNA-methyltransferase